jgi:restriction system protein
MVIPSYSEIMLPLLNHLSDGCIYSSAASEEILADKLSLSEEEREELQPSGRMPVFKNRISWAKTYLKMAGLIDSPKRGQYQITQRGLEVLKTNPKHIDIDFLKRFPEFNEFLKERVKGKSLKEFQDGQKQITAEAKTPEEYLEYGHRRAHENLGAELLRVIKDCSPSFFERLVVELLLRMGYGGSREEAARTVGRSGDGGIDGIIKEDRLGLDTIYIQAKRWEGNIGRPEIQKFAGALQGMRARKGVFITTSCFTKEAEEYARYLDRKIILISGAKLAALMIDYDVGVNTVASYALKNIDMDYFVED